MYAMMAGRVKVVQQMFVPNEIRSDRVAIGALEKQSLQNNNNPVTTVNVKKTNSI